jgi:hypothetical protein
MNTKKSMSAIRVIIVSLILIGIYSCKNSDDQEVWTETKSVAITPYKSDPEDGKQYLDIIYENVGNEVYRKIKFQLIRRTGTKYDTTERVILPETIVKPNDKRLIPRRIGQPVATFDDVKAGKVWVVVDEKK